MFQPKRLNFKGEIGPGLMLLRSLMSLVLLKISADTLVHIKEKKIS
jgi:hypothetical protein